MLLQTFEYYVFLIYRVLDIFVDTKILFRLPSHSGKVSKGL